MVNAARFMGLVAVVFAWSVAHASAQVAPAPAHAVPGPAAHVLVA